MVYLCEFGPIQCSSVLEVLGHPESEGMHFTKLYIRRYFFWSLAAGYLSMNFTIEISLCMMKNNTRNVFRFSLDRGKYCIIRIRTLRTANESELKRTISRLDVSVS